jgi:hypothetical protein
MSDEGSGGKYKLKLKLIIAVNNDFTMPDFRGIYFHLLLQPYMK